MLVVAICSAWNSFAAGLFWLRHNLFLAGQIFKANSVMSVTGQA